MERAHEELALTQMRKSVEKLGSSTESFGDPTLMRFLIARAMDPEKAGKMFVQWRQWRAAFVPLGYIPDSEVPDELESRKICLQGLSKNGLPVMIVRGCNHFPAKDQLQFKKFLVHLLDKTLASSFKGGEIGNEKLIGILDLQHMSYKNIDARALITGAQFLQAYYPERLAKFYLLHMPLFFVAVWKLVSRFLEKATLEKVKRMVVSTYQAASGAGAAAMEELVLQTREVLEGKEPTCNIFKQQYAFNLFSHNASVQSNGYNEEEMKLVKETRKIWNDKDVKVTATCIRVPVMRAHAESVNLQFEKPLDEETAKDILKNAPGIVVVDDRAANRFPTPLEVSNKDDVAVGRIRRDISQDGDYG